MYRLGFKNGPFSNGCEASLLKLLPEVILTTLNAMVSELAIPRNLIYQVTRFISYFYVMSTQFERFMNLVRHVYCRVAQCIDKGILIRKICNIDIGIDIDKENFEKLIRY